MVETRGGRRFAVAFLAAAFIVFLLGDRLGPVHRAAEGVAAPFEAAVSGLVNRLGDGVSGMFQGELYRQQYEDLLKKYGLVMRQNISDQLALHDLSRLEQMLKYRAGVPQFSFLTARVIGTDVNGTISPFLRMSKGANDGVKKGMTVLNEAGFFVGTVSDVYPNASDVQLLLGPSSTVGAVDASTGAKGDVIGVFNDLPQLKDVPTNSSLRVGDFVVTSGDWNLFPRGVVIGQVARVVRVPTSSLQHAVIEPSANFGDLEIVQVIRNFVPSLPPTQ